MYSQVCVNALDFITATLHITCKETSQNMFVVKMMKYFIPSILILSLPQRLQCPTFTIEISNIFLPVMAYRPCVHKPFRIRIKIRLKSNKIKLTIKKIQLTVGV